MHAVKYFKALLYYLPNFVWPDKIDFYLISNFWGFHYNSSPKNGAFPLMSVIIIPSNIDFWVFGKLYQFFLLTRLVLVNYLNYTGAKTKLNVCSVSQLFFKEEAALGPRGAEEGTPEFSRPLFRPYATFVAGPSLYFLLLVFSLNYFSTSCQYSRSLVVVLVSSPMTRLWVDFVWYHIGPNRNRGIHLHGDQKFLPPLHIIYIGPNSYIFQYVYNLGCFVQ